jgi:hypothetical protein
VEGRRRRTPPGTISRDEIALVLKALVDRFMVHGWTATTQPHERTRTPAILPNHLGNIGVSRQQYRY